MAERAHQQGKSPHPTGTASTKELPVKAFRSRKAWEEWLAKHHDSRGVWLKLAKKGAAAESLTYPEALEVALCYGWIDGQGKGLDEQSWFVRFGPRRPRSEWSRINPRGWRS